MSTEQGRPLRWWVPGDYACAWCGLVASSASSSPIACTANGATRSDHDWRVMYELVSEPRPSLAEHAIPCLFPTICARCAPLARTA